MRGADHAQGIRSCGLSIVTLTLTFSQPVAEVGNVDPTNSASRPAVAALGARCSGGASSCIARVSRERGG
jgi:hypothetical protein